MFWNLYTVAGLIIRKLTTIFWNITEVGAIKVFNGMKPSQGERAIHAATESKLKEYCTPKETWTFEKHRFHMRMQKKESFEEFLADLKITDQSSSYDIFRDSILRNQIVIGIKDPKIEKRSQEGR